MAYATKYLFKWQSAKGTTREIRILKNGYSGSVIQRALGRAPILKKQKNGAVFGTSLEFYAECKVEGEFTEFYTTNPKAYKVQLYAGNDLLWQGYVTPELYSEPDIAPPFDVQVIATDGIGELKLYDFGPQGMVTLRSIFTYLLGYTGLGTDVYLISSLKAGSSGAGALLEKTINLDYMAGESCYDVLTYLLDTLHATITWWKGAWIVARETNVTFTSGKVRYFNTAGNSALLAGSVQTLGKMYTNDVWPVGQLSRKVDPAKKSVTIQAPWHVVTAFVNSGMDSDSGWTKANNASFDSAKKAYYLPDNAAPYQGNPAAEISQAVSMGGLRVPLSFSGKFCATELPPFSGATYGGVVGVDVLYVTGNVSYYLTKDDNGDTVWKQGNGGEYDFQIRLSQVNTDEAGAEELTFEVPPLMLNNTYPSGTLTFHIVGRSALVFNAFLDIKISKGYQDRLHIDNGARGEEGEYEVAIGRETSDIDYYKAFMQGILLDSGSLITSFKDDAITTGMDFLSFISRDYARSFALPRIVRTGTVQLEAAVVFPPLVLTKAAVDYWLETWSWNMYEDELDITARSLPTASVTVDSEVISEASGTTSSGSRAGGGSSSMSGGGGSGNYFELDDAYDDGVKLKDAYVGGLRIPGLRLGEGRDDFDLEVKNVAPEGEDPVYALYSPLPLITGGDQILGDGTPGGGTPTGVSYLHELLDVNISNPTNGQILAYNSTLQKWVNADAPEDSVQKVAGVSPDANGDIPAADIKTALGLGSAAYKDTSYFAAASHTHSISGVSGLDANLTTISGALQSLQAQIDAVASRDCFGELTVTAVTADRAVASEMYAERYYLTNGLYFYVDIVDGVACVHLNAPFITDGDQILGDGTPGGGGGTGATYLWQLDDVDVPSVAGQIIDGQALVWDAASSKWKNRNITQGTVTRVDVGSTQYSPENGVVSLPAYPTTLPASDVYAWAKASTKPSYSLTEISGTADLQAIEALSGTSGLLRKTAANTWQLDTNSYVTSSGVTSITAGTGLSGGTITGTGTIAISSTYQDYIAHGESAYNSLSTVSTMLQSLQSQIDAVASRDMFEELSASAFSASVAAVSELRAGYAYAERYYLTDDVYFTAETVDGVVCVKLNSPFITTGDQILGSGGPSGGGGGGDISYLYELTDVDDNLNAPASGTILQWYSNKWVGTAFTSITNGDLLTYASGKWTNVPRTSVGIVTDATTSAHGLMSAADKTKLDGINTTYISNGQTAYENLTTVSAMLQSLQKQVDSVASRDMYEELGATAFYSDVAGIGSLIADNIELGGESLKAIPNSYLANHSISINGSTVNLGGSFSTASITAGTAGTSSATSGASISIPYVTMNAYGIVTAYGTHTHSVSLANLVGSSAVGSASLPVYYNGSALTACTGSSLFSDMSSGPSTNLSVTVAGQTRTATLYATYDSASENISDKFGIVSGALQSLQKQIDSVASRSDISDYEATTEAKFDYVCDLMRSLQAQIDSVASRTADVSANGYFDVISVGRAIYGDVLITSGDQTLSDERRKTITREITLTAEQIASCRAVAFDWKDKPGSSFGSIAQDWQKILPESVNDVDDTLYHFYGQSAEVAVINLAREVVELKKIIKRLTS